MVDWNINVANPVGAFLSGYEASQNIASNRAREERAAQAADLATRQAEQSLLGSQQAYDFNAASQPYQLQQMEQQNVAAGLQNQQRQQQLSQAEQQQAFQAELGRLSQDGLTFDEMAQLNQKFPQYANATQESFSAMTEPQRKASVQVAAQGLAALRAGQTDVAKDLINRFIDAAEASGDEAGAASARASLPLIDSDPKAAVTALGAFLSVVAPDQARAALGQSATQASVQSSRNLGPYVTQLTMRDGTIQYQDARTGAAIPSDQVQGAIDQSYAAEREQRGGITQAERSGTLQANIDQARTAETEAAIGRAVGTELGARIASAGSDISRADNSIALIDSIITDPALEQITGRFDAMRPRLLQSQEGIDLMSKVDQISGQAFLAAFDQLRGGGVITDREGAQATAAVARLDRAQSKEAYIESLNELKSILQTARERARGMQGAASAPAQSTAPSGGGGNYGVYEGLLD